MSYKFETYRLAETARQKLLYHASRTDHDLRCLVLHANLLDTLLLELNSENDQNKATDGDSLPTLATYHARIHGSTEPVILVTEANEDASDDEDEDEEPQTFLTFKSSPDSPPMLSHDTDSDSEYSDDSDTEHEDSDSFKINSISGSPVTPEDESVLLKVDEKDDGLELHRTISHWRFPQHKH